MKLRRVFVAGLATLTVLVVGCGSSVGGTAAPAPNATTSATSATTTTDTTTSATTTSSSTTGSRTTRSTTTETTTTAETTTGAELDETTAVWLDTACSDLTVLLTTLFALPTVDATTPFEDYRLAHRDYYATLADTVLEMIGRLDQVDPPTIDGGADLHDAYRYYLLRLADISGSGAIAIDGAEDIASVDALTEQIQFEMEQLGEEDLGLASFSGGELQEVMQQVPACEQVTTG